MSTVGFCTFYQLGNQCMQVMFGLRRGIDPLKNGLNHINLSNSTYKICVIYAITHIVFSTTCFRIRLFHDRYIKKIYAYKYMQLCRWFVLCHVSGLRPVIINSRATQVRKRHSTCILIIAQTRYISIYFVIFFEGGIFT